jgi:hypothetical protein
MVTACIRYESVNELDVPGLCPKEAHTPALLRFEPQTVGDSALHGRVVNADGDAGLGSVQVRLSAGGRTTEVVTDSTGRFTFDSVARGRFELLTRRIGFAMRRDSLSWPLDRSESVLIPLKAQLLDGPCSGFAVIRMRKPWWKLW